MLYGEAPESFDRRSFLRAMGAGTTAALAGCAGDDVSAPADGTAAAGERSVGGSYVEVLPSDATSLNVLYQNDATSEKFVGATMDFAYDFREIDEIVPLWVESVTETDKRVWEYTLRDSLRWSDPYGGLTAEDWVYSVMNLYQGEDNWAGVVQYSAWQTTDEDGNRVDVEIEKTGKRSFRVTLPEPQPSFLADTAMWGARCLPKDLVKPYVEDRDVEGLKQDEELNRLSYTGNLGPYDFETWEREDRFVATRAEEYYLRDLAGEGVFGEEFAEAPYFEEYRLKVLLEESTRLSALEEGGVTHYGDVPSNKVDRLQSMDHLKFRFPPDPFCSMIYYNQRANGWELLRDADVRRALSTAVHKPTVVEDIYRGFPTVAHTFQPEWSPWYAEDGVLEMGVGENYSHETAREMLAEATDGTAYGYDGDALVGPDGEQVTLQFVYVGTSDLTRTTAEYVAQELSKVGIAVEPTNGGPLNAIQNHYLLNAAGSDEATFNGGPRDEATSERPWDLLLGVTLNAYPINPDGSSIYWNRDGSANFFGYVPEADVAGWYETAKTTTDEAERRDAFARVFGALSREQPVNFLCFDVYKNAYATDYLGMPESSEYGYMDGWDSVTWYRA